ncbi:MAG: outer membrane beta-barrel protein [Saprospiraceae bacterium]|nr:outer membrane beta-barrel protein [Saprospiraceae bacterium]
MNNNNSSSVSDPNRTNSYNYREQIHAAYIQASQNLPWMIIKGWTKENIPSWKGKQSIRDTIFKIQ